ncbi:MAG: M20/M25/M40 family metallo-hydrolase [Bacillota bacterium]
MIGWGWFLAGLSLLWAVVLLIRAAILRPGREQSSWPAQPEIAIDQDKAAVHLSKLLQCKTVSHIDQNKVDFTEFEQFRRLLMEFYPAAHQALQFELVNGHALLYRWKGQTGEAPLLLMAHYDVVPADATRWKRPPFAGLIEEGVIWGRGALDTKGTLCGIFEAVEKLAADGFKPVTDIYLAFSHDEETMGRGAHAIVDLLKSRGIRLAAVLDEGGAVVEKVFPGVNKPIAVVGLAEKGVADLEFIVEGKGGHASTPGRYTPLTVMSAIITRVDQHPFKAHLPVETKAMLAVLGKEMPFRYRIIFANLWCFKGLIAFLFPRLGKETNAMCRSTCVFTMAEGSCASNVLPGRVRTVANLRLTARDPVDRALEHVSKQAMAASKKARNAKDALAVNVKLIQGHNASPSAKTSSSAYKKLSEAVHAVYPEAVVSPYLMMAATDSRHYCAICDNVLRFSPIEMSVEERDSIHAADERIPVEKLRKVIEFYIKLVGNW